MDNSEKTCDNKNVFTAYYSKDLGYNAQDNSLTQIGVLKALGREMMKLNEQIVELKENLEEQKEINKKMLEMLSK